MPTGNASTNDTPAADKAPAAGKGLPELAPDPDEGTQGEELEEAPEGDEQPEGEGDETEVELEDFEFDGVKAAIPKTLAEKLKAGALKSKDYTKKTQEISAEKAKLKERADAFAQREATQAAFLQDVAEVEGLRKELAVYDAFTEEQWQHEFRTNQANYEANRRKHDNLRRTLASKVGGLREKDRQRSEQASTERKRAIDEGRAIVAREIPGWNDEAERNHKAYASSIGFTDQEVDDAFADPRVIRLLNKAYVGEQLSKKATAANSKSPTTEPLKQVGKRSAPSATGLSDNLSTEEWMRRRSQQLNHRRQG